MSIQLITPIQVPKRNLNKLMARVEGSFGKFAALMIGRKNFVTILYF
jgi:hypothetical protein